MILWGELHVLDGAPQPVVVLQRISDSMLHPHGPLRSRALARSRERGQEPLHKKSAPTPEVVPGLVHHAQGMGQLPRERCVRQAIAELFGRLAPIIYEWGRTINIHQCLHDCFVGLDSRVKRGALAFVEVRV